MSHGLKRSLFPQYEEWPGNEKWEIRCQGADKGLGRWWQQGLQSSDRFSSWECQGSLMMPAKWVMWERDTWGWFPGFQTCHLWERRCPFWSRECRRKKLTGSFWVCSRPWRVELWHVEKVLECTATKFRVDIYTEFESKNEQHLKNFSAFLQMFLTLLISEELAYLSWLNSSQTLTSLGITWL